MAAEPRSIVIFDLGGVLVDWDPRHLYRQLFPGDEAGMEQFLAGVCTNEWNLQQDAGRSWAEATALLRAQHPGQEALIDAFHQRWPEMIRGAIDGTVEILRELREAGVPLYALTNWSAETFPVAEERFDFMGWFRGVVVSGREKLIKPDPRNKVAYASHINNNSLLLGASCQPGFGFGIVTLRPGSKLM